MKMRDFLTAENIQRRGILKMSRFCSLFSSSSGNSTYIGTANNGILVDAGVSAKQQLISCVNSGIDIDSIRAIFITHEHTDHVKGLKVLAKKLKVPIFATEETLVAMCEKDMVDENNELRVIDERGAEICGMEIMPFTTPHDSAHSVGYTINMPDERKISVCTDLGTVTDRVFKAISGSDLILLESNHDVDMLKSGPYPYSLKQRILSTYGHLPNEMCAETAVKLLKTGTTRFVLGHLSKENNTPEKAWQTSLSAFEDAQARNNVDYQLFVAGNNNGLIRI